MRHAWDRIRLDGPWLVLMIIGLFCMWKLFNEGGVWWLTATIVSGVAAVLAQLVVIRRWRVVRQSRYSSNIRENSD